MSLKSCYKTYDDIITSCQRELERQELDFEQRKQILDQMLDIAKMKSDMDGKNKKHILSIASIGLVAIMIATGALITGIGGNSKFSLGDQKMIA